MTSYIADTARRPAVPGCRGQGRPRLIVGGHVEPSASPAPMTSREQHRAIPTCTRPDLEA